MNTPTPSSTAKLVWKDEYSVNVKEIDDQHKNMFEIINSLIEAINAVPNEESIAAIIKKIVEYKACHFCTEETYFQKYNFDGAKEHINAHNCFNIEVARIQNKHKDDIMGLAFELVDFLENWLIEHLMKMDQKYKKCFNDNGLH